MADEDLRETVVGSKTVHRGRVGDFRIDTVRFERRPPIDPRDPRPPRGGRDRRDRRPTTGSCSSASGGRLPAGSCSRSRPGRSTSSIRPTGRSRTRSLAAPRELEEETGYRAGELAQARPLLDRARLRHRADAPVPGKRPAAGPRAIASDPDEDERLELVRLPFDDALAAVERRRDLRREVDRRPVTGWPASAPPAEDVRPGRGAEARAGRPGSAGVGPPGGQVDRLEARAAGQARDPAALGDRLVRRAP